MGQKCSVAINIALLNCIQVSNVIISNQSCNYRRVMSSPFLHYYWGVY